MSKLAPTRISRILDHFYSEIRTVFPEHQELFDADDLFENPAEILAKGFGIVVGPGENTNRCLGNEEYYWLREFTLILTQDFLAIASDPLSKITKSKLALEWFHVLLNRLAGQNTIIVDGETQSFKVDVTRDSGPRTITVNDAQYLFIELTVTAEYREPKTT